MQTVMEHRDLLSALQNVARAVPARTTLPVLSGILVEAADNQVKLAATDLELGIECHVPARVEQAGSVVLPARYLTEIIRRIPDGRVEIQADPVTNSATIHWGTSEFTIHGHHPDQFPSLPKPEAETELEINRDVFRAVLEGTLFATSQDETRPILTGVQLTMEGNRLKALSTDGYRIAQRQGEGAVAEGEADFSAVVPGRNLGELLRLLGSGGTARTILTRNQVFVTFDGVKFVSRLLEGQYPAVMDLVPRDFPSRWRVDRQLLHDACERVSLLSDPLQRSYAINLRPEGQGILITASSAAVGNAREEIPAGVEGEGFEIIFNARYLAEGLRNMRGGEVLLELSGPLKAARLTTPDDPGFLYVLMPMRPSEGNQP